MEQDKEALQKKRTAVVNELRDTEKSYVEKLSQIVEYYETPLTQEATSSTDPFITLSNVKSIFSSMDVILGVHKYILTNLEKELSNWNENTLIGPIFISSNKLLKVYKHYCSNYTQVHDLLVRLKTNPKFNQFLDEAQKKTQFKLDLESYLIRAVQRIPQYLTLLNELIKNTWKDHPDYNNLVQAVSALKRTGDMVNEYIRDFENIQNVYRMSLNISGFQGLATPARRHVFDAPFKYIISDTEYEEIQIFLFNDIILYASLNEAKQYKVEYYTYLINTNGEAQATITNKNSDRDFILHIKDNKFPLQAMQPSDKEKFLNALSSTVLTAQNNFQIIRQSSRVKEIPQFNTPSNGIQIIIKEARNLKAADLNGKSDPYCKIIYNGEKTKTKTQFLTLNPVWDYSIVVPKNISSTFKIELEVWDHDDITSDDFLGYAAVELDVQQPGEHWIPLSNRPKKKKTHKISGEILIVVKH